MAPMKWLRQKLRLVTVDEYHTALVEQRKEYEEILRGAENRGFRKGAASRDDEVKKARALVAAYSRGYFDRRPEVDCLMLAVRLDTHLLRSCQRGDMPVDPYVFDYIGDEMARQFRAAVASLDAGTIRRVMTQPSPFPLWGPDKQ